MSHHPHPHPHPHPQPKPHHRRTLASSDTMDPTPKSTHPKLRHHHNHPHPQPDPTILPPSTIQNISHRFSKLYANHKKIVQTTKQTPYGSTLKPQLPLHPEPDTDLQTKPICLPTVSDTKCTTLTKSNSQHERFNTSTTKNPKKEYYFSINSKVKGRNEVKKQSLQEKELEKGSQLICSDKIEEGFEAKTPSLSMVVVPPPLGNGGRRKSFCSSQVELADFLSCSGVKVVAVDMPPFMQIHAVDCARKTHDSLEKFTSKTLALTLKKEFDGVYGPAWHCIVGTSFGSFVTHSVGGFMYFSMDHKLYILLFKTTVQKAAE